MKLQLRNTSSCSGMQSKAIIFTQKMSIIWMRKVYRLVGGREAVGSLSVGKSNGLVGNSKTLILSWSPWLSVYQHRETHYPQVPSCQGSQETIRPVGLKQRALVHEYTVVMVKRQLTLAHRIALSPNGWTNDEPTSLWFKHVFILAAMSQNPNNQPLLLIMDVHSSHCTKDLVNYGIAHTPPIHLFLFPPHTTHQLQPRQEKRYGKFAGRANLGKLTIPP